MKTTTTPEGKENAISKPQQKNLFGETEREKFILYANKKNTIFCNYCESGIVDTPVILSEFENLLIEEKFKDAGHLENTDYLYMRQTGIESTIEYQEYLDAYATGIITHGNTNLSEAEAEKAYKAICRFRASWKPVDFNKGWALDKGKISNGINKVSLTNFNGLAYDVMGSNFWYNTKYNYFKLIINDLKIYIVGEFE